MSSKLERRIKQAGWCILAVLVVVAGFVVYGFVPKKIKIETIEVVSAKIGTELEGLDIVFLADFHFKRADHINGKVLGYIKKLDPDIVLLGGDYVEDGEMLEDFADFAARIPAKIATYAVMGNWAVRSGVGILAVTQALQSRGVVVLNNEVVELMFAGQRLNIAGVGDAFWGYDNLPELAGKLDGKGFTILLSHIPAVFDSLGNMPVDLMLAGHTHGGQIVVPLVGPLWLPFGSNGYVQGEYEKNGRRLYVTRGLGTSFVPVRIGSSPEITLIKLKSLKDNKKTPAL